MTVQVIEPRDIDEAFATLTNLADEYPDTEFVFRGHQNSLWRLQTSYDRYWHGAPLHDEFFVERMVARFRSGVIRLGLDVPRGGNLDWLEHGRHHGLPAPLLDFTWSPFVALFFAFDGVRTDPASDRSSAIYCLNLNQLAKEITREQIGVDTQPTAFTQAMQEFLHEGASHFEKGFPQNRLLFLRYPNAYTRRMHAQLGTFLYSTIQFGEKTSAPKDLEAYFECIREGFESPILPNEDRPVLLRMKVPHAWLSKVFSRLEIMGIAGSTMYLSAEGVAKDVYNAYNFEPRAAYLRGS
jgi:hypothetical protein